MQKNWYVLYTRPQSEKKVATLLTKKKVEHFIPLVCIEAQKSWRHKAMYRPLFKSYVFVFTTEQQAALLMQTDGVINLLHWLGKPAVINETEINAIKEFTSDYQNIDLEKLAVNSNVIERNIYRSSYEMEGNILAVKNKTIKINLPSLGYAMIARLKEDSIFGKERSMLQNYTFAQS
ncbi:transcription termination/antitermination NusG family protein [Ferruginibacter sp. SUN106]|uniref:transcription termination/antitermination NusG family protein n=1 Tax=Ferruginibacter sp. SUN106 TaxID=2978348 RepID=UPI003D35D0D0